MNKQRNGCLKFETLLCASSSHKLGQFVHLSNLHVGTRGHTVYTRCCKCVAVVKISAAALGEKRNASKAWISAFQQQRKGFKYSPPPHPQWFIGLRRCNLAARPLVQ